MASFTECFTNLRHDCDQSHQHRQQFFDDVRTEVKRLREEEVPHLLGSFRDRHAEVAERLRNDLAEFAADLRRGGEFFRSDHSAGHHATFPTRKAKKGKQAGKR